MPRGMVLRSDTTKAKQPFPVDFLRSQQFAFLLKAAPYYREARQNDQLAVFLESFFGLWYTMWPQSDSVDPAIAHERTQQTRRTVIFNLAMASVFYVELDKTWEEFRVEKLAEHVARKSRIIEHDSKGRPLPFRRLKAKVKQAPPPTSAEVILVPDSDNDNKKEKKTAIPPPKPDHVRYIVISDSEGKDGGDGTNGKLPIVKLD